ncbi:MAG: nucleotidyl transferase [Arcobacter sp.]|uniref:nucleotidyltransferase family protein n=1 Tax=uncultured Arcobacter sp. TaxID=165434 RepID=UPI000CBCCA6D|nr:nucleotidyltransferase family protein [uncultured Arcobacter sp.]PLY08706.1 MAG: nucleotidyl transferase [Arcobacter sp.]
MNKLVLQDNTNIQDAISLLDKNGKGALAVVDLDNQLIGLITDGDIRKAFLNNNFNLNSIINNNPHKMSISSSKSQIVAQLKKIHRRHMPLVNNNNEFEKLYSLDEEEFNLKSNWVVIMAGGLGKRLKELTKDTPKPMLKIGKKPILEHIVEQFISFGFTKFILCVNYKSELIKNHFKNGEEFGVEIVYIEEKTKLGTGGALSLLNMQIKDPFFIINGDILTNINFNDLLNYHNKNNSDATMCIKKDLFQIPYGVVEKSSDNIFLNLVEKPQYTIFFNAGVYILNPETISFIPHNVYFDLPNLFQILNKNQKKCITYEIEDYWIDIGKKEDYLKANEFISSL